MLPLCIAVGIVFLDQLTKQMVQSGMFLGQSISVIPGVFQLRYIRNTGAAWGIFAGANLWLALLSVVMLGLILAFRKSFLSRSLLDKIVMGLMIAGIVGNLIDRLKYQYVIDFLDFYWKTHHFPAFNIADAAICSAVGFYILSQLLTHRKERLAASLEQVSE